MRFQSAGNLLLLGALAALFAAQGTEAKVCLMLYQMADNNLEFYLRQDYEELTQSAVVSNPDLRTWYVSLCKAVKIGCAAGLSCLTNLLLHCTLPSSLP